MRQKLLILAFAPVLLLAFVIATANYASACHCEDIDQDGYGAPGSTPSLCTYPEVDCDDDPSDDPPICATCNCGEQDCALCATCINVGAPEAAFGDQMCADGTDNDCDGLTDALDTGCQECSTPQACDDTNPCTLDDCVEGFCAYTFSTDPCDDGNVCTTKDVCLEGGCTGTPFDLDQDEDGHVAEACQGDDCDDSDPNSYPGAIEGPAGDPTCMDGADNDCNGYADSADAGCAEAGWALGEEADAAVYHSPLRKESSVSNLLFTILIPVGAMLFLRRAFKNR